MQITTMDIPPMQRPMRTTILDVAPPMIGTRESNRSDATRPSPPKGLPGRTPAQQEREQQSSAEARRISLSTPIRKFCDISLRARSGGDPLMSIDASEEPGKVVAGE